MNPKYIIQIYKLTDILKNISGNRLNNCILKNSKTFMYKITYEQKKKDENGPKLIEIKDFVFEYFLNQGRNTCKCCINFLQEVKENNNYYTINGIDENIYFKKSELYKKKDEIEMFINLNENCTCNKFNE